MTKHRWTDEEIAVLRPGGRHPPAAGAKMSTILAWHFVGSTLRDGRPVPADGRWLEYDGPLIMCQSGLHASRHPFDALKYAPGNILCRVECDSELSMLEDVDKLVCYRRRIIKRGDMTDMLRYFARMQALSVIHLWDAPDIVLDYLMSGNDSIRNAAWAAARDAAWAATEAATMAATWAATEAARAATRAAARAATEAATMAAARAATWDATEAATEAATWAAARDDFSVLVEECFA